MPRVPTYDNLQATPQQVPNVQQVTPNTAEAAFTTQGRQLDSLGQGMQKFGADVLQMKATANEAAVKDMDTQLTQQLTQMKVGYLSQMGGNAAAPDSEGVTPNARVMDAASKVRDQMMDGITDPQQKEMFTRVANQRIAAMSGDVQAHYLQQTKQWGLDSSVARASAASDAATASYNPMLSPDKQGTDYTNYIATQQAELLHQANERGITDKAARDEFLMYGADGRSGLASTYTGVIGHLMNAGQSSAAMDYYKSIKDNLPPALADKLQKDIQTAATKDDSLKLSMQLTGDLTDQRKQLDDMFSNGKITAEVHDATMQRVEHNWQVQQSQKNEMEKQMMGNITDLALKGAKAGKPISVNDLPADLYTGAKDAGKLADAYHIIESINAHDGGSGATPQVQLTVRGGLLQTAAKDPDAFISEYKRDGFVGRVSALGVSGVKEMQDRAQSMIEGNGKYSFPFNQKILQDAIPSSIVKDKDKSAAFTALMVEAGDRWKKANPGREPDQSAYAQMAAEANANYVSIGHIWNSHPKAFEVRAAQNPDAMPQIFYDNLKARGLNEDQIKQAWALQRGK